jgi:general secretion pathway protein B
MSYILDALRKSDQQRRRGAVPGLPAAPVTITVLERSKFFSYALLGIFLLEIIIAIVWLHPWRSQPPEAPTNMSIHQPSQSLRTPLSELGEIAADASAVLPGSPQQQHPSAVSISTAFAAPVPELQLPASTNAEVTYKRTNGTNWTNRTTAIAANPASANNSRPPTNSDERPEVDGQEPNVIASAGPPSSFQATLPPMAIAVHAYSSRPQDRLVSINERVLHEGDYLAPDLKLEQITPDGMIFNYRGNRVQRGAQ